MGFDIVTLRDEEDLSTPFSGFRVEMHPDGNILINTFNSLFGILLDLVDREGAAPVLPFNSLFGILKSMVSYQTAVKITFNSLFGIPRLVMTQLRNSSSCFFQLPFRDSHVHNKPRSVGIHVCLSTPFSGFIKPFSSV